MLGLEVPSEEGEGEGLKDTWTEVIDASAGRLEYCETWGWEQGVRTWWAAAMRRVRAACLRSACDNPAVVPVAPGAGGTGQIQTHSSMGTASATAFPR